MADENRLKARIQELEGELGAKDAELAQMRLRLAATNSRLEQIIDRVSHEIHLAGKIQKLLSPVEIPNIQGFEVSSKFVAGMKGGGDYFDLFEHEDRLRFGIVLTASSGYTMSALLLSMLMRISSRMESRKGMPPHEMIETIGREIQPELKGNESASIFYGVVDRRTYELSYCCLGSIAAFVQTPGNEALTHLEPMAQSLGKSFNTQLRSLKLSLNSKDRLILCSDGVMQAADGKGQNWGETGVREAIRMSPRQGVHELRNEILYRCEAFTGKTEPDRDQTVLVLEVKDKVLKLAKN